MGGKAEAWRHKMSHVRLQTETEGELEIQQRCLSMLSQAGGHLGKGSRSWQCWMQVACHERGPYIFSVTLLSTALCSASKSARSPRQLINFLLEMKMRLTWPGESAGSAGHHSHHCALLSWRQLMVMRDWHLFFFKHILGRSWCCFSVGENTAWLREKYKITSL